MCKDNGSKIFLFKIECTFLYYLTQIIPIAIGSGGGNEQSKTVCRANVAVLMIAFDFVIMAAAKLSKKLYYSA